ncbi:MAG: DUF5606 domain-containing protein [bacterium]
MDLSKILSISGKPGLYLLVGEAKNSIIVESLTDGKKGPAFPHERISSLKEISIYTEEEDKPLDEVFRQIHELTGGKPAPNPKKSASKEITDFFAEAIPDYDRDAVYTSDMKKILGWYNFLLEKGMMEFTDEETGEEKAETGESSADSESSTEVKDEKKQD